MQIVTNAVKKLACGGLFSFFGISISFTIPFIICVQTATNDVMKFRLRRASGTPIFQFRQFLTSPKFIPAYATARDCTKCIHEPPGGCKNVLHPLGSKKKFRASCEIYTPQLIITSPWKKFLRKSLLSPAITWLQA